MIREKTEKKKTHQVVKYARQRMHDLEVEISEKTLELAAWESVIDVLKPCERCDGAGEIRYRVAQDETAIQICEKCKGTGRLG